MWHALIKCVCHRQSFLQTVSGCELFGFFMNWKPERLSIKPIYNLYHHILHMFFLLLRVTWTKRVVKCNQCSVAKQLPKPSEMRINTFASFKTETDICWWTVSLFTYAALWTASSELNRKWIPERIYRDQGEDIRWVVALYWNLNKQHLLILGHQWSHRYLQGVFISVMTQLIWSWQ